MLLLNLRNRLFLYRSGTARCFQCRHAKRLDATGVPASMPVREVRFNAKWTRNGRRTAAVSFQRRKSFQFSEFCEAGSNRVVGSNLYRSKEPSNRLRQ